MIELYTAFQSRYVFMARLSPLDGLIKMSHLERRNVLAVCMLSPNIPIAAFESHGFLIDRAQVFTRLGAANASTFN